MPITPFHFGPGLLVKGLAGRRFSWTTFAAAQVLIDCEVLYHIVRHEYPVHRGMHTLIGATSAGLAAAGVALALRRLAPDFIRRAQALAPVLRSETSTVGIVAGGIVGGASHPFLDALMHADVRLFAPWSAANPLLGSVAMRGLHLACLAAGVVGAVLVWLRAEPADGAVL